MDPMMQAFINWLTSGAAMDGVDAILAIATVTHFITIPGLKWLALRLGQPLSGISTNVMAAVCGVATTLVIAFATGHRGVTVEMIETGIAAGLAAVGIHQARELVSESAKALKDQKQMLCAAEELTANLRLEGISPRAETREEKDARLDATGRDH